MALSGQIRRSSDASYLSGNSWRSYIGDPSTDADRLRSTSPVNAAGNIVAPLLLFHGRKDTTVLPAQSERMVDALDQKGKWVKLIMFEDEDHWIARNATGKRMLAELETFLAEHLKK
jgi:dipeptidyl aminopeptidase/acylaminoacyl peptidase